MTYQEILVFVHFASFECLHVHITGVVIFWQVLDIVAGGPQLFRKMVSINYIRVAAQPKESY